MSRVLSEKEKALFVDNRPVLHEHLSELQADLEDMTDDQLIECRSTLLKRVNLCMEVILETDEDNDKTKCCYNCTHCRHYYVADMYVCHLQHRQIADGSTASVLLNIACDSFEQREAGDDIGDTI